MDWFLYDSGLRHERVKSMDTIVAFNLARRLIKGFLLSFF